MAIEFENKAREYIKKIYSNVELPLPDDWNSPEILSSLGIAITTLDLDLATKPEIRQLLYDSSPEKCN